MSSFHIDDLYDLANQIEMKRQEAVERAERLSQQWEIVQSRIERLEAQEGCGDD